MSKKKKYNLDAFSGILERNRESCRNAIREEVIIKALLIKHPPRGLLCVNPYKITKNDIEKMKLEMEPLIESIGKLGTLGFSNVLNDMHSDPGCRNYLHSKAASSLGKEGGKPRGSRAPHTVWLDNAMKKIKHECDDGLEPFTITSYFDELLKHPDIDDIDENNRLWFKKSALEGMGYIDGGEEPTISRNMVEKALTRLNKTI